MSEEIKKIKRDLCLIKFRKLPLIEYEKESDTEIFHFPKSKYYYWIKLENNSSTNLVDQITKMLKLLNLETFIFLNATNKSWISKQTEKRKDYKPLIKTVEYFKSYKISNKFNGGIQINFEKLKEFLPHFYRITECDSGFYNYYFTDFNQNIIFYIHYSGEIQIMCLNEKINTHLLKVIKQTKFIDSLREKTNRI